MDRIYRGFLNKITNHRAKFDFIFNEYHKTESVFEDWQLSLMADSLVDEIWQTWCLYTKRIYVRACFGGFYRSNICYPGLNCQFILVSKKHILASKKHQLYYFAKNGSLASNINKLNKFKARHEITWGDIDKIVEVYNSVRPADYNHMLSYYGASRCSILKDLQVLRNYNAHKGFETFEDVKKIAWKYGRVRISNSFEFLWLGDQVTRSPIYQWIDLMVDIVVGITNKK